MKKKKILLILLFILITTFGLMPKAKAASSERKTYYQDFNGLTDAQFFKVTFDSNKRYYIKQSDEFRGLSKCWANGKNCVICDSTNYGKGLVRKRPDNDYTYYLQNGAYSDFRYYMTHYSAIWCWGENQTDEGGSGAWYSRYHKMITIVDLDDDKVTFSYGNNKTNTFYLSENKNDGQTEKNEKKSARETSAKMAYLCWMSETMKNQRPAKYAGTDAMIIKNESTKKVNWKQTLQNLNIGDTVNDKKISEYKKSGKNNYVNLIFFEPQRVIWSTFGNDFKEKILYNYGKNKLRIKNIDFISDSENNPGGYELNNNYTYSGEVGEKNGTKMNQYAGFIATKKYNISNSTPNAGEVENNVKISGYKIDTEQTSSQIKEYTYKTVIGPYYLNLNEEIANGVRKDNCNYSATIKYKNGSSEGIAKASIIMNINESGKKCYYICSQFKFEKILEITLKENYDKYRARLIFFAGESRQTRAVVKGIKEKANNELKLKIKASTQQDVSLQQYITNVYSPVRNNASIGVNNRKNKKADVLTNINIAKRINDSSDEKKQDAPVKIFLGDTVTYTVHVYNNLNTPVSGIEIKNGINKKAKFKGFNGSTPIEPYYTDDNNNYYLFKLGSIPGNEFATFTFKVEYTDGSLMEKNIIKASTYNNQASNTSTYRLSDGDYIKMYEQDVSVQMCITKQSAPGRTDEEYTGYKENDRRWRIAKEESINKIFNKEYDYEWDSTSKINMGDGSTDGYPVDGYSHGTWTKESSKVKLLVGTSGRTGDTEVTFTAYFYNNTKMDILSKDAYIGIDNNLTLVRASSTYIPDGSRSTISNIPSKTENGFKYYKIHIDNIKMQNENNPGPLYSQIKAEITVKGFNSNTQNYCRVYLEEKDTECRTEDFDYIKISEKDVSLQMYITQRMDMNGTEKQQLADSRQNQKANSDSNTNIASGVVSTSAVKSENKVKIEQNEKVKFKIRVYNNGATTLKNQVVKLETRGLTLHNDDGIWQNNETTISEIGGYEYVDLYAIISGFTKESADNIRVYLPDTDTEYRTEDLDYVTLGEITSENKLSIQKYIVQVNNNKTENRENWSTKGTIDAVYRISDNKYSRSIKGTNKKENPILIKQGDIVYYKINVYNNNDKKEGIWPFWKDTEPISGIFTDYLPKNATYYKYGNTLNDVTGDNNWNDASVGSVVLGYNNLKTFEKQEYYMAIKFDEYTEEIQENKVNIPGDNSRDIAVEGDSGKWWDIEHVKLRVEDSDYVRITERKPDPDPDPEKPDISLQKFISNVEGQSIDNRENRIASNDSSEFDYGNHTERITPDITSETWYTQKINDSVEVRGSKEVTYTIKVYNNKNVDTTVQLKDKIQIGTNNEKGELVSVSRDGRSIQIDESSSYYNPNQEDIWKLYSTSYGERTYAYRLDVPRESTVNIEVKVKFTANKTETIKNLVWISSAEANGQEANVSDFKYRTADADYVKIKAIPNLKIKKYIEKITDSTGGDAEDYTEDRKDNPTYKNDFKERNMVYAEKGDKVTYKIIVENISNVTAKISEIEDYIDSDNLKNIKVSGIEGIAYDGFATITFKEQKLGQNNKIEITLTGTIENFNRMNIANTAKITQIKDEEGNITEDSDPSDNEDTDYMQEKIYSVSIEKYVSAVNGNPIDGRSEKPIYLSGEENNDKFNNPVTVNENDEVTYTIKVKNEGSFKTNRYEDKYGKIKVSQILDALNSDTYGERLTDTEEEEIKSKVSKLKDNLIATGESSEFTFTYTVNVPNITLKILTNTATITEIKNRNDITVTDEDTSDNEDKDYIQLDDIEINGMVWNDKPLGKDGGKTNGYLDNDESGMSGIEVYLYRDGKEVASTTTSNKGEYTFKPKDVTDGVIKASKTSDDKKWDKYYNYYVVFKYDGMTYTSTVFSDEKSRVIDVGAKDDNKNVSNAAEDYGIILEKFEKFEKRKVFNEKFLTINKDNKIKYKIEYTKNNDKDYIPNSKYIYNDDTMSICSSTNLIELKDDREFDNKLTHVDLGLRNRDVFDLELVSDVVKTQVTVNGETAEYNYGGKVKLRQNDADNWVLNEDCKYDQNIRTTDFDHDKYNKTGLEIKVTYKITVYNMSQTYGTATKIVDYYDKNYKDPKVYLPDNKEINPEESVGTSYKFIEFEIPKEQLSQGKSKEIFIELTVDHPETLFKSKLTNADSKLATYNMVEIAEYTTDFDQNEYMKRGLMDKDSEPQSVELETVNLRPDKKGQTTTLDYYFTGENLEQLKYEDDTFTAPVLYFVCKEAPRKITGIVFKDKNGDGIYKKADGDKIIEGANVTLVETVNKGAWAEAKDGENHVVYTATTDSNGIFTIEGFLPGVHHMEYQYGNNAATLIIDGGTDSYNGYLYESTKNYYENVEGEYWYKDKSDRKSTATERARDRDKVSDYTKTLNNAVTKVLNCYMIERINQSTNVNYGLYTTLMEQTKMTADTPDMRFDVEKEKDAKEFKDYDVENIDFGIRNRNETHITLDKKISSARITDSTGKNVLVNVEYDDSGKPIKITGDAIIPGGQQGNGVDISMIDKNLQGAKLDITYEITVKRKDKKGTDNGNDLKNEKQTITLIDYVPNSLNVNGTGWEQVAKDRNITAYDINLKNTINKVKREVDVTNGNNEVDIKMETVLTAVDSTIESIITSADSLLHEYKNIVEVEQVTSGSENPEVLITKQITNDGGGGPDKISDTDIKPLLEGAKEESIIAASDLLSIHPPTGSEGLSITHYIIGATALIILSVGIVLIKKFALKKE